MGQTVMPLALGKS